MKRYYQILEVSKDEASLLKAFIPVYKKSRKYYTLEWGHAISTLAEDRVTVLYNTDIPGVIEAENDDDAVSKLGLTIYT